MNNNSDNNSDNNSFDNNSDNELINMLDEIDNMENIDEIENNINFLCDKEIEFKPYKKSQLDIKMPHKKTDMEIMDMLHSKIKEDIYNKQKKKELDEEKERERIYKFGINKTQPNYLVNLDNIPDPISYNDLLRKKGKKNIDKDTIAINATEKYKKILDKKRYVGELSKNVRDKKLAKSGRDKKLSKNVRDKKIYKNEKGQKEI